MVTLVFMGLAMAFLLVGFVATYIVVTATFVMALVIIVRGFGNAVVEQSAAPAEARTDAGPPGFPILRVVKDVPPDQPHVRYRRTLLEISLKEAELAEVERRILLAHAEARKLGLQEDLPGLTASDRARAGDLVADIWLLKADKSEFESDSDAMKLDALAGYPMR